VPGTGCYAAIGRTRNANSQCLSIQSHAKKPRKQRVSFRIASEKIRSFFSTGQIVGQYIGTGIASALGLGLMVLSPRRHVSESQTETEAERLWETLSRGRPYGNPVGMAPSAGRLGLEADLRLRELLRKPPAECPSLCDDAACQDQSDAPLFPSFPSLATLPSHCSNSILIKIHAAMSAGSNPPVPCPSLTTSK
jgi:hypothetical protein